MSTPSPRSAPRPTLFSRLFGKEIERRVQLAVRALDDAHDRLLTPASTYPRDRYAYDRRDILERALEAWRDNALARRVVALTTQYVVGNGIIVECSHISTHHFVADFWSHRLNHMDIRVREWCDELTRTGDLFILLSTDAAGMSYVRAVPSGQVQEITSAPNDIEQEQTYHVLVDAAALTETRAYPAYNPLTDAQGENGDFSTAVLHYAINRPVGAQFGESDLAPMLKWFTRYSGWLEDRVRLNRFRQVFNYVIKGKYRDKSERLSRQAELNSNPPNPGSILVSDESETWSIINPQLDSYEAAQDGLAVKKMITSGAGIPLHFLSEPESATRTTAEAAGGPTYRHFEQRQEFFCWLVEDLLLAVIQRRSQVTRNLPEHPKLKIHAGDISGRDNSSLANAASLITAALYQLYMIQAIDKAELLRMVYRFAGETLNTEDMLKRAKQEKPQMPPVVAPDQSGNAATRAPTIAGSPDAPDPPKIPRSNLDPEETRIDA